MSASVTVYNVKRVESERTHSTTVDIHLYDSGIEIRAFLSDELAKELIAQLSMALVTKKVED